MNFGYEMGTVSNTEKRRLKAKMDSDSNLIPVERLSQQRNRKWHPSLGDDNSSKSNKSLKPSGKIE